MKASSDFFKTYGMFYGNFPLHMGQVAFIYYFFLY